MQILNNCVRTDYRQPVYGQELEPVMTKVYPFVVKKWPKAGATDIDPSLIQEVKESYESIDVDA